MTGLCGPGFDVTDFFGTLTSPAALEQDLTYREEKIPEIITERLDAIDKVLFGQPFDDFEADRRLDEYRHSLDLREFLPDEEWPTDRVEIVEYRVQLTQIVRVN